MDVIDKRNLMMKHYNEPKNKGFIDCDGYILNTQNNASCIDEVKLMTKIKDGKIVDIRFDGEACAVCTASTSIMIETLLNKSVTDAKKIVKNFDTDNLLITKEWQFTLVHGKCPSADIIKRSFVCIPGDIFCGQFGLVGSCEFLKRTGFDTWQQIRTGGTVSARSAPGREQTGG